MWEQIGLKRDDYAEIVLTLCKSGMLFLKEHALQVQG